MEKEYIAVIDSGIGGISVLKALLKSYPNENYIYFGDNDNVPYGNKRNRRLFSLTRNILDALNRFRLKAIVIGCNTLSLNIYNEIKNYVCVPVIPTFPPVESRLVKGEKVLLLATVKSAEKFKNDNNLKVISLPYLALDIEKNKYDLTKVKFVKHLPNEFLISENQFDTVILGCTHYFFIKNQIFDHFRPQNLISGEFFATINLSKQVEVDKSLVKYNRNNVLFLGKNAVFNQLFFNCSGQE